MGCLETRLAANEIDWAGLTMLVSAAIIVTEQQVDRSRSRRADFGSLSSNLVDKLAFQLSGCQPDHQIIVEVSLVRSANPLQSPLR